MSLREYQRKRNFDKTREPAGAHLRRQNKSRERKTVFVVQEHHARRLHWDLRLEVEGVLKSWAVTRQPSLDPADKRLAVQTEDHPMGYAKFHGEIPKGEYGAGTVMIWDNGTFESAQSLPEAIENGVVEVTLHGKRLKGRFVLVRTSGEGPKSSWLFFKAKPKPTSAKIPDVNEIRSKRRAKANVPKNPTRRAA